MRVWCPRSERREDGFGTASTLTQVAAVETALEAVASKVLEDHVSHCVPDALASGDEDEARAKTDELLAAVHRIVRTG